MRPIWSGTISFGLVNIPVGVYTATKSERVGFHLLHEKDMGRIQYLKVCKAEDEPVANDEIVKGYEYEKGEYVVLTDEDFESVEVESTRNIDIEDFVDADDIDPMYFDQPYYLAPGKGKNAEQTYVLLRETLKKKNKIGIGKLSIRQREYLAAIKPKGAALMLDTMHFAEEIRDVEDLNLPSEHAKVEARHIKIAEQLVDSLAGPFKPEKYHDRYREALEKLIEKKIKGVDTKSKIRSRKATNVVDIMDRLNASLKGTKKKTTTKRAPVAKKRTTAKAKKTAKKKAA